MALQTIELDPGAAPAASVIVLHGLGADGTDFLAMADEIDLAAVGPVRWVLPRAPMRPVTINGGYVMRAWYDILGTEIPGGPGLDASSPPPRGIPRAGDPQATRREDEAGLRESFAAAHALVGREVARGVPSSRIVLAGFSQGCAITLGAGLRCPHRLAGLAGMSGYLPLADAAEAERHAANAGVPVFLAHGQRDGVVPIARGAAGRDLLQRLGHDVEWHDYPMEHSVCIEEVRALEAWLRRVLA